MGSPARRGIREGLPPDVCRVPRPRRGSLPRRMEQPLRAPGRGSGARAAGPRAPSRPVPARARRPGDRGRDRGGGCMETRVGREGGPHAVDLDREDSGARPRPQASGGGSSGRAGLRGVSRRPRKLLAARPELRPRGPGALRADAGAGGARSVCRSAAPSGCASALRGTSTSASPDAPSPDCRPRRPTCSSRRAESPPPRPRPPRPRPRARRSTAPRACSTTATPA